MSASGFYYWQKHRFSSQQIPEEDLIQLIFHHRKSKAGARTIKMLMARDFWMIINLKKIRRIMKKYHLQTIIRRRSKHRFFSAASYEHKTCKNHLNRSFHPKKSDEVYSTDITYLNYGKEKAYLSAVKDLGTQEILNYRLSRSLSLPLAMDGVDKMLGRLSKKKLRTLIVHSDQGHHYTSHPYRALMKRYGVIQSMSRRGNCIDNAPIESFFGHMKDELDLPSCKTFNDLAAEVDRYMYYYNNERPQWGLNGKTPAECRGFL